jgi:hypothetical protein
MSVFGKVTHSIIDSEDGTFHIFNILKHGGTPLVATYVGIDPPTPMKTVEYEFRGDDAVHPKYGKQFSVNTYTRSTVKGKSPTPSKIVTDLDKQARNHMNNL